MSSISCLLVSSVRSSSTAATSVPPSTTTPSTSNTTLNQPPRTVIPDSRCPRPLSSAGPLNAQHGDVVGHAAVRCGACFGAFDEARHEFWAGKLRDRAGQLEQTIFAESLLADTRVPSNSPSVSSTSPWPSGSSNSFSGHCCAPKPKAGPAGGSTHSTVPGPCSSIPG